MELHGRSSPDSPPSFSNVGIGIIPNFLSGQGFGLDRVVLRKSTTSIWGCANFKSFKITDFGAYSHRKCDA